MSDSGGTGGFGDQSGSSGGWSTPPDSSGGNWGQAGAGGGEPGGGQPGGYGGGGGGYGGQAPPNYLVWSILTTILCCLPAGVVSIVYAAQVNSKAAAGDYAGAQQASANAKRWAIISAVAGVVVLIVYVALFAGGMMAGFGGSTSGM